MPPAFPMRVLARFGLGALLLAGGCAATTPVSAQGKKVLSHFDGKGLEVDGAPPVREAVAEASAPAKSTYVVQKGDTMYSIARRHGTSVDALAKANGLDDPTQISVGQSLEVPHQSGSSTSSGLASSKEAGKPSTSTGRRSNNGKYRFAWPVQGVVTSRFGSRWGKNHDGIDIGAPMGTPVKAAADGKVLFSARHGSYGNLVVVKHDGGLVTVYAHHQSNLVREGQKVTAGQTIARVGNTGRSTGPHLHFEVRRGTKPINPLGLLPP